jgi:hypothetical protein
MLRRTLFIAGVTLTVIGVSVAQSHQRKYFDLRPELAKNKFTEGRHLIKALPDGLKVSLGFKASKVAEIYLTDRTGKELKAVLAEGKVSHDGVLPPEAQRTPRDKIINIDYRTPGGCNGCEFDSDFNIGEVDGEVTHVVIQTCCGFMFLAPFSPPA